MEIQISFFVCGDCAPPSGSESVRRRRKCVVIGLNGVRPDTLLLSSSTFLLPFLRKNGVFYTFNSTIAGKVPVSYPSWAETFTGTLNHSIRNTTQIKVPRKQGTY